MITLTIGNTIMAYRPYVWRKENREKRMEQKKREKIRAKLRKKGILPPYGEPMNEEQIIINNQIANNDFSSWESVRNNDFVNLGRYCVWKPGLNVQSRTDKKDPQYLLWYRAKSNAKDRKYDFNLDTDDIIIPEFCPYLNVPLETDFKKRDEPFYYSIDRIDSSKGYVKGNVQVISKMANTMKLNADIEQLITFAENILKLHS
jgi:hypothetical protein